MAWHPLLPGAVTEALSRLAHGADEAHDEALPDALAAELAPEVGLVGEGHLLGSEEVHGGQRSLYVAQDGGGHIGQQLSQAGAFLPSNSRRGQRLPHIGQAAQEGSLQALQVVAQAFARHSLHDLCGGLRQPRSGQQGPGARKRR